MEVYLQSLGVDIWDSVENGYEVPKTTSMDLVDRGQYKNNSRAKNEILSGLENFYFTKVMQCT